LLPSAFTVTNTADSGDGSLRQAILNVDGGTGGDMIAFDIGGGGEQTIRPTSALPAVTQAATIDGTTQPGFSGTPVIELDGGLAGAGANGLTLAAAGCVVRGLVISHFSGSGIVIQAPGNATVQGNFLGTDVTGTHVVGNNNGVSVSGSGSLIGGTGPGDGNLIAGNNEGVHLGGSGNLVEGNTIGTDVTGTVLLGDGLGVLVPPSGSANTVGGTAPGAGNLISGSRGGAGGVELAGNNNVLQGNRIGTDASGTQPIPNNNYGVLVLGNGNFIGGSAPGAGNVVSGNNPSGIGVGGFGNVVQGNYVGTDATGTRALPNLGVGIQVSEPSALVGGTAAGAGNVVSGNGAGGILIQADSVRLQGNYIGTDATGTKALPNRGIGVWLFSGSNVTVGGTAGGAGNLISGNGNDGVSLTNQPINARIEGNLLGIDITGTRALPNGGSGVTVSSGARGTVIGGTDAGAGNLISGNTSDGITVRADGTTMQGNTIGTDVTGTQALPNGGNGVSVISLGVSAVIGGTGAGAGNLISGNGGAGVAILGGAGNVLVAGNGIGTDVSGSQALGNQVGVSVSGPGTGNLIGEPGAGNLISGNVGDGLDVTGNGNQVLGNLIGADATGTLAVGNGGDGVHVSGSNNAVGGTADGAGNVIAFNGRDGVRVDTGTGNAVLSDAIFANGNLGIELTNHGNNDQPAPTLTSANQDGPNTVVQGTLLAAANTTYTVQLFANPGGGSGAAEGQTLLGTFTVTTDDSGLASFTLTVTTSVPEGQLITATATDGGNNTSAFSGPVVVMGG
jgi:titin